MDHRDKLGRATEHFQSLKAAVLDYSGWNRSVVPELDAASGRYRARFKLLKPLPRRWSLILGDAIHNVRSSLDALAFSLSVKHSGPPSEGEAKKIQFLIADTAQDFVSRQSRSLGRLPSAAQQLIEGMQPYHTCSWPGGNPLASIRDLDNTNKHRHLIIAKVRIDHGNLYIEKPGVPGGQGLVIPLTPGFYSDGDLLAEFDLPPEYDTATMRTGHSMGLDHCIADVTLPKTSGLQNYSHYVPAYIEHNVFRALEVLL